MLKLYCRHCGSPNMYTLKKPDFCQSCGKSFSEGYAVSEKKSENSKPQLKKDIKIELEDEEPEESFSLAMTELDIEIDVKAPDTHTMQSLSEASHTIYDNVNAPETSGKKVKRRKARKTDQPSISDDFKKEAGFYSARQNSPEE